MPFGVLVVGSPGAGKSTFCQAIQQIYTQINRKCVLVNLDPANDQLPYECDYDVRKLVDFEKVCREEGVGPNYAFLRCMEILEANVDILREELSRFDQESTFFFDCPGQVELYSMHNSLLNIINDFNGDFSFSVANLMDSTQLKDFNSFLAITMITMNSMLHLGLPQVNFVNKFDLMTELPSPLHKYCAADLHCIAQDTQSTTTRHQRLTAALTELIEECALVSFVPLAVEDKECMVFAVGELDRVSGRAFGALSHGNDAIGGAAYSGAHFDAYVMAMEERYLRRQD
jgi:GTPase SAR1 family protein